MHHVIPCGQLNSTSKSLFYHYIPPQTSWAARRLSSRRARSILPPYTFAAAAAPYPALPRPQLGRTSLIIAAMGERLEVVQVLLTAGADKEARDTVG